MLSIFIVIFVISLVLAFRSMKDFEIPKEIRKLINLKNKKGSIVFFKNKVKHYQK